MVKSNFILILFALFLLFFLPLSVLPDENIDEVFKIDKSEFPGKWEILENLSDANGGSLKIMGQHWLMYFLHWQPLTPELEKSLSPEYVRKRLLNFWGPNMPFELTGNEGEITINGHKAYWVEGTIYKKTVKTRFIIWNCPESGRQFIADTNVNKRLETPDEFLLLQTDMTKTIGCHGEVSAHLNKTLDSEYKSDSLKISFLKPSIWSTGIYEDKKWYPDGVNSQKGSLWTLPTGSEKLVIKKWKNDKLPITTETLKQFISELEKEKINYRKVMEIRLENFRVEKVVPPDENTFTATGKFSMVSTYQGEAGSEDFFFTAYLWYDDEKTVFLMTGMVDRKDFWEKPVDLTPTAAQIEEFNNAVLKLLMI
ncbi:MAG: hypothetical protein JW737_00170 [Acidobacteria bacterium]|nr:hypothetical protein [Acidobacteriota bacterium]